MMRCFRLLLSLGLFLSPMTAFAQQVWFSSGDDLEVNGVISHPDFMQLFSPRTWPVGAAHVNVMQLRAPWFARMPDPEIQPVLQFLEQNHIALSVPMSLLPAENCGQGVEGIMQARGIAVYPRKMKEHGADLAYVVMDEPLYYGHDYNGKNACHFSIEEVAQGVTQSVRMIRSYYPNAQFILSEPPQGLAGGVQELAAFLDAYEANLNEYPISFRFDVQWHQSWRTDLPPFIRMLKARGIGYGIIYNATHAGIQHDDASWIASAKANVLAWESAIPDNPDHVVIQTWNPHPVRITPEIDPTTMTGYLKWFVERKKHERSN